MAGAVTSENISTCMMDLAHILKFAPNHFYNLCRQDVIALPFKQNGVLVGCKYRTCREKKFWQVFVLILSLDC